MKCSMTKFNITRKDGKQISKEDIQTFYLHLSVVCMKLGLYAEDVEKEKPKGTYTAEDLVIDDVGQVYNPTFTKEELQISKVNPNCEVCDD